MPRVVRRPVAAATQRPRTRLSPRRNSQLPRRCSSGSPQASDEKRILRNGATSSISATSCSLWMPGVVDAEADVQVDVREHLGQVAGMAVVRVGVQQEDPRAPLRGPDEVGQEQRIAATQVEVRVPVAGVDLERQAGVDPGSRARTAG